MIHTFLGKGGVGKSTIASALALALSNREKVGLLSLDPMSNLGDIFEMKVGNRGVTIGNLYVREIDVDASITAYLRNTVNDVKRSYRYLSAFNLDNRMDAIKFTPGIEEHVILDEMATFLKNDFESFVIDMPPAGMALRILALPYTEESWLDSLIEIRNVIFKRRESLSKISGLPAEAERDAVLEKLRVMKSREMEFERVLQGSEYYVVKTPEVLAMQESVRIKENLKRIGFDNVREVRNMCGDDGEFTVPRLPFEPRGIESLSLLGVEKWLQR